MATIRTAIALYDGVTSPLHSMQKAMNIVLNSFEAMQRWLAGYEKPDFITINRFRNRVKKEINEVFTQTVLLLSSKGFIMEVHHLYADGRALQRAVGKLQPEHPAAWPGADDTRRACHHAGGSLYFTASGPAPVLFPEIPITAFSGAISCSALSLDWGITSPGKSSIGD